jgi:hypothetical protein
VITLRSTRQPRMFFAAWLLGGLGVVIGPIGVALGQTNQSSTGACSPPIKDNSGTIIINCPAPTVIPNIPNSSCPSNYFPTKRTLALQANCGAVGGKNCSGTPSYTACIAISTSGNPQHTSYLDINTANIEDKSVAGDGNVWVSSSDRTRVCGSADASVTGQGASSRVSGILSVQQMDWRPDPSCAQ